MTPIVFSSINSKLMLCVFVCSKLAINLITCNRVFPTRGSRTPQVVFMTSVLKKKKKIIIKQANLKFTHTQIVYSAQNTKYIGDDQER